jgi:TIR domain/Dimerisation domain of Zinc Transporter
MQRWFLSYNSQDFGLMQSLERALKSKDPGANIFFAPKSLRAGGLWLPELARAIAEATAFVLLIGEKGIAPWQAIEYYEALDRRVKEHDFPVILILLEGQAAPGLPFLRQLHWVISADLASEQSLARLMDAASGGGAPPGELWRLRVRATPDGLVVNYHCRVSPYLSVDEVHEHVDELDRKMRAAFTGIVRIVGHAEPLRA